MRKCLACIGALQLHSPVETRDSWTATTHPPLAVWASSSCLRRSDKVKSTDRSPSLKSNYSMVWRIAVISQCLPNRKPCTNCVPDCHGCAGTGDLTWSCKCQRDAPRVRFALGAK
ncbi:hypothetical protein BU25DRAFT_74023 [Macroventuria anomochaeta]|uniref:Uncharacterized protein n=1 Tax=Macroventuria anomochaeta TaxID=301207 RepID=A0ACB6S020_9PLEO|nr:uncharacterized protein BU25DRAFT_74023 [Macroventuria anomochaeta]KAF2626862.1 hypothetical protein BU25DRAFT_74023 [Macroventuria anomochaeta]